MSCGIYLLKFVGIDLVYVGQSTNIEKRFTAHVNNLVTGVKANIKLHAAYTLYGLPSLEILELCEPNKLSELEAIYIKEFDSVNNGLNILENTSIKGYSMPGIKNPNSKYSMETCEAVFHEIISSGKSLLDISKNLNVHKSLVHNIANGTAHRVWLEVKYPDAYKVLLSKQGKWRDKGTTNLVQLKDPSGLVHTIETSLKEFAVLHGLNPGHVSSILSGKRHSHKGWTLP